MVRKATLSIGKSETVLFEQRILGLNRQLSKLNCKVDLISEWIYKKFGVFFLDEACAALMRLSVNKSAGSHSSLNPGSKKSEGSDSDEKHSDDSEDDNQIVESESNVNDDDRAPLKSGEPEIRTPPERQHKGKDQRNKLARLAVQLNSNRRYAEVPKVLADRQSEAQCNASKRYCEWQDSKFSSTNKKDLIRHHRTHSVEKPFSCTWLNCGKSFAVNGALVIHRRKHTGDKPYHCDWPNCGKPFAQISNFQTHRRTHTGERPFSCSYCDSRFGTQLVLTWHVRTHTGEKPYICDTCGAGFAKSSGKVQHEKLHRQNH